MLKKCSVAEIQAAVDYIGEGRLLCFYLYMDVLECGIEDEGLGLWISENNNKIQAVYYRYYDCLHTFSHDACPKDDILQLITEINPKVITGKATDINLLQTHLDADKYTYELNHIITTDTLMPENPNLIITQADEKDVNDIAELMMKDHIYNSVYTHEKLCNDLIRRHNDGFGRMFIIRDENHHLLAANATYAETNELAVIGGLVTDPNMRGKGLGRAITAHTWNLVKKEGKQGLAFLMSDNENTQILHQKMGYIFLGESARLVKNN